MIYTINYLKIINNEIEKLNNLVEEEYQIPINILEPIINPGEKDILLKCKEEKNDKYNMEYSHIEYKEYVLKIIKQYLDNISFHKLYGKNITSFLNSFLEIFKNDLDEKIKGKYILGKNKNYIVAGRLNHHKLVLKKVNDVITDMGNNINNLSGFDKLINILRILYPYDTNSAIDSVPREVRILEERNENYIRSLFKFDYSTDFINVINSISNEYKIVGSLDLIRTVELVNANSTSILDNIINIFTAKIRELESVFKTIIAISIVTIDIDKPINAPVIDIKKLELVDKVMRSFFQALEESNFVKSIKILHNKSSESFNYINRLVTN